MKFSMFSCCKQSQPHTKHKHFTLVRNSKKIPLTSSKYLDIQSVTILLELLLLLCRFADSVKMFSKVLPRNSWGSSTNWPIFSLERDKREYFNTRDRVVIRYWPWLMLTTNLSSLKMSHFVFVFLSYLAYYWSISIIITQI